MKMLERKICVLVMCAAAVFICAAAAAVSVGKTVDAQGSGSDDYIKWVSFTPTVQALRDTLEIDIETYGTDRHIKWSDSLAYLACKCGESFKKYKKSYLTTMLSDLGEDGTVDSLMAENKYYSFYKKAYAAVLDGFIGEFTKYQPDKGSASGYKIIEGYGLKAYLPIAEGFWWNHYDDFGVSREYGFRRKHLGNDLMGSVGTPIVAIEGGTVEIMGWNRYGGWRIAIRSFDGKRSYYYAHLRKNSPYHSDMKVGATVKAGQVIGYLGMTGYSIQENVNGMDIPHLHMGLQLVFDESQKEGNNQIWIDIYALMELVKTNRATVRKEESDYYRMYDIMEPQYPEDKRILTTRATMESSDIITD